MRIPRLRVGGAVSGDDAIYFVLWPKGLLAADLAAQAFGDTHKNLHSSCTADVQNQRRRVAHSPKASATEGLRVTFDSGTIREIEAPDGRTQIAQHGLISSLYRCTAQYLVEGCAHGLGKGRRNSLAQRPIPDLDLAEQRHRNAGSARRLGELDGPSCQN
ncbi:hypothetical protein OG804_26750 [Nocardia sp. NBC_00416]